MNSSTAGPTEAGGAGGGVPSGATYGNAGGSGNSGLYINAGVLTGAGASTKFGAGGAQVGSSIPGFNSALPGTGYGAGGGGRGRVGVAGNGTGGVGSPGIVIIYEYT
ncbi:hypothetical protein HMPREF0004_5714 [Achromobacter piechaudii ATCC 43553]|uniref:Uncharacterized protein n=1 Tax=Achromobacter piechaudii ATCC 43553 TaxID=742159 RepID=D4XJR7_9BURK|nr:hypothetical protein HMPREF0004_5714 [Achromobacter piechaudii ATCC 43553]